MKRRRFLSCAIGFWAGLNLHCSPVVVTERKKILLGTPRQIRRIFEDLAEEAKRDVYFDLNKRGNSYFNRKEAIKGIEYNWNRSSKQWKDANY